MDKLFNALNHWSSMLISHAGKILLLNSVILGTLIYWYSAFILPKTLVLKINSVCSNIYWGDKHDLRHIHWLNWARFTKPRDAGDVGIKEILSRNKALFLKWFWKLKEGTSCWSIWARCYLLRGGDPWKLDCIWESLAVPKDWVICWTAYLKRLATIDLLQHRGFAFVNMCVLCCSDCESHEHLFFACPYASSVSSSVLAWFGLTRRPWSLSRELEWVISHCKTRRSIHRAFRAALLGTVYHVWRERNSRVRNGDARDGKTILNQNLKSLMIGIKLKTIEFRHKTLVLIENKQNL
ncbi:hypothetical protein RND81_10G050500 [Saponaria officinalis]|uniref:Reverse transcriptase zinc-binding domain-containing protein n=1 Tax=Saponaria officinalis TaxID=3572 RepID=A0AAW1HYJ5_SAPOF